MTISEIKQHSQEDNQWWGSCPDRNAPYKEYYEHRLNAAFTKLGRCMGERSFLLSVIAKLNHSEVQMATEQVNEELEEKRKK